MKKHSIAVLGVILLGPFSTSGQVTITAADFFNKAGLFYRAYANNYDPGELTGGTAYTGPGGNGLRSIIGLAGTNQFWDFSKGPTNKVFRYDYVTPASVSPSTVTADFPAAKIVEQQTDESDGSRSWLFFEQVPGVGRTVYGFYASNPLFTPSNLFDPPIVDFPSTISYGSEWTTSTTYENDIGFIDPDPEGGGAGNAAARMTLSSKFKVDAIGTIVLPSELGVAFGQGLRVNEEVTIDVAVDIGLGDGFQHFETDYTRNYYWLMPGFGIVAQLNSTQFNSPPSEVFPSATAFLRMFQTNKSPTSGGGCVDPAPVTDLKIRIAAGQILLTWSKADCATQYRVEYSTNKLDPTSWTALGAPTTGTVWQGETTGQDTMRFYRVVSLK